MKVYVITFQIGHYEDFRERHVGAFLNETRAQDLFRNASAWLLEHVGDENRQDLMSPFDPGFDQQTEWFEDPKYDYWEMDVDESP